MTGSRPVRRWAAIGAAALLPAVFLFLPFLEVRPNRVLAGRAVFLFSVSPSFFVLLCGVALLMAGSALSENRIPGDKRKVAGPSLRAFPAPAAAVLLAAAAGWAGSALVRGPGLPAAGSPGLGPAGRVTLGAGFWAALFVMYCHGYLSFLDLKERPLLRSLGFWLAPGGLVLLFGLGVLDDLSLVQEFFIRRVAFFRELRRHGALALGATILGTALGVPLGVLSHRRPRDEKILFFGINLAQTVPTLSLLGLLILPLALLRQKLPALAGLGVGGTGWAPALIVLCLYALLPVAGNTLAGLRALDPAVVEAARGMGMGRSRVFFAVELPLALPVVLSGIRTALTQSMGNAILAGLIGGGGMGAIIFLGLAQAASDLVLLGALPVAISALLADRLMHRLEDLLLRRGGRGR